MDVLYDKIVSKYEIPWVVFSILRELYTFDLDTLVEDLTSPNSLDNLRGFLLSKRFKSSIIYQDTFSLPPTIIGELRELQAQVREIDPQSYESYVLMVSYMTYVLDENLKDLAFDFMNFVDIKTFFMLIEVMQKHSLTQSGVKELFANYIIDLNKFPEHLKAKILKAIVTSSHKKVVNISKDIEIYRQDILELCSMHSEADTLTFAIVEAGKNMVDYIPNIESLKAFSILLIQKSMKATQADKLYMRDTMSKILIQLPRMMLNAYLFLLFKFRESAATKITTQNKNLSLFIDNQLYVPEGIDLAWFTRLNGKRTLRNGDSDSDSE